jgi:hypothetical protein
MASNRKRGGQLSKCPWCNELDCNHCRCRGYPGCNHNKGEQCLRPRYNNRRVCNPCGLKLSQSKSTSTPSITTSTSTTSTNDISSKTARNSTRLQNKSINKQHGNSFSLEESSEALLLLSELTSGDTTSSITTTDNRITAKNHDDSIQICHTAKLSAPAPKIILKDSILNRTSSTSSSTIISPIILPPPPVAAPPGTSKMLLPTTTITNNIVNPLTMMQPIHSTMGFPPYRIPSFLPPYYMNRNPYFMKVVPVCRWCKKSIDCSEALNATHRELIFNKHETACAVITHLSRYNI